MPDMSDLEALMVACAVCRDAVRHGVVAWPRRVEAAAERLTSMIEEIKAAAPPDPTRDARLAALGGALR